VYAFFRYSFKLLLLFVTLVAIQVNSFAQDLKLDSLKKELSLSQGTNRLNILNELFKSYNRSDFEIALEYAKEFDHLARLVGDSVKIVQGGRMRAYSLMDLGKNEEAIGILNEILSIAERNKVEFPELKKQIKIILNNAGIANMYQGNYDKALECHFKSLVYREEEGDKKSICTALNNIGLVFYKLNDPKKAIEYYLKTLEIKKEIDDKSDLNSVMINVGLCYNQDGEYKKAIDYFNQGFEACGLSCSDDIKMEGFFGLGIAYFRINNLEKANENFHKSLEISRNQKDAHYQCDNLYHLSLIEYLKGRKQESIEYLNESERFAKSSVETLLLIYKQFAKLYESDSKYEKSNYYLKSYTKLKDSIYSEDLIKNLAKVQTNYAERENIKTIKEKDQVLELRQALIERQKAQYVFIVAITLLVLVLGLVLLIANRRQQRASAELANAKVKIEEQNRMLAVQNKELDARVKLRTAELSKSNKMLTEVNSELDNFLYKTSHDIRGPLVTLKGLCNLALIEAKEPSLRDILDKLDGQSDKMAKILSRLTAVGKVNQSNLSPVKINFKSILDGILKSEEANSLPKNVNVTYELGSNLSMISDAELVTNILENLIDNGIKFYNNSSRVDPFVHVIVKQESNHVMVKVEDNGIGILNAKPDEVFHMFMRASERSDTGGVGLYLSKICTDKLGGEIKLDQTSKDGSTFVIQFPLDLYAILAQRKLQEEALEKQRELEGEVANKTKATTST
jgi:signal transduction histidine kinase